MRAIRKNVKCDLVVDVFFTNLIRGKTPYVGDNGNWWIDAHDTGICARAKDGENGRDGKDGLNGQDGNDGADGRDGLDGTNGRDGVDGYTNIILSATEPEDKRKGTIWIVPRT